MKKIVIGVVLLMGLLKLISDIFGKTGNMPIEPVSNRPLEVVETNENTKDTDVGKKGSLQEILGCDTQCAEKIAFEFEKTTGKPIGIAELLPSEKKSYLVKAITEEKEYYLTITSTNMLRTIREDSEDGKIIYQIIY